MNNFLFYKEWIQQLKILAASPEDVMALLDGLQQFMDGEDPEQMTPMAALVFNQMTAQIRRDKDQYDEISKVRSEAGKKGMEKRWSTKDNKQKQTITSDNKQKQKITNDNKLKQTITNDNLKEDEEEDDDVSPNGDVVGAEPLIGLPLNDGTEQGIFPEDITEYSELYPSVDVMQELRNMRGWLLSNPGRRKTKRGIKNFITTWLAKEQDKPRARSGTTRKMTAEEILAIPAINPWSEVSP